MPLDLDVDPQQLVALGFMVTSACALVVIGSKRSLAHAFAGRGEMLSTGDAAQFPIMGSLVLFTLYVVLRLVPRSAINWVISTYLTLVSIKSLATVVRRYVGANVAVGGAAVAVGVAYFRTRHWVANNALAYAIAVVGIEAIQLQSFAVSATLLSGLFIYDVFWVFGTDVMVTVAKGIDGPIKLVFPQTIFGEHNAMTMLGLGDIVIPGFFISQMLRFSCSIGRRGFYFHVAMAAYLASLVNTMVVMVVFKHAQPALLYIVPWLLLATLAAALLRGDLGRLFAFSQELVVSASHRDALVSQGMLSVEDAADAAKAAQESEEIDATLSQLLLLELLDTFGLDKSYRASLVAATAAAAKQVARDDASSTAEKARPKKAIKGKEEAIKSPSATPASPTARQQRAKSKKV